MQRVRNRHIHEVDVRIVKEILVRAVRFSEAVLALRFLGLGEAARSDGVEDYRWVGFRRVDYCLLVVSMGPLADLGAE